MTSVERLVAVCQVMARVAPELTTAEVLNTAQELIGILGRKRNGGSSPKKAAPVARKRHVPATPDTGEALPI